MTSPSEMCILTQHKDPVGKCFLRGNSFRLRLYFEPFLDVAVIAEKYDEGDRPGDRVRKKKDLVRGYRSGIVLVVVESSEDPQKTKSATSDNSRDHREYGAFDATEHTGTAVHKSAEEVRNNDEQHSGQAECHALRGIRKIQAQKRCAEQIRERSERQSDESDRQKRGAVDRV